MDGRPRAATSGWVEIPTFAAPRSGPGQQPVLVNFGCGSLAHPAWINFDVAPRSPEIREADFRDALPFADASVDAVYHSHVLEHLDRATARRFLAENVRVLRPGGVLRVVVPDLQALCRHYLAALDAAVQGGPGAAELYDWSCLDLLDQMVRRDNCGDTLVFLEGIDLANHPAIAERLTLDLQGYLMLRRGGAAAARRGTGWRHLSRRLRRATKRLRQIAAGGAVRVVAGAEAAQAFREGLFRNSGEVHHWMYDAYSLSRALAEAGLARIASKGPTDSAIPGFAGFDLDTADGRVRRPGSLFMEGVKP